MPPPSPPLASASQPAAGGGPDQLPFEPPSLAIDNSEDEHRLAEFPDFSRSLSYDTVDQEREVEDDRLFDGADNGRERLRAVPPATMATSPFLEEIDLGGTSPGGLAADAAVASAFTSSSSSGSLRPLQRDDDDVHSPPKTRFAGTVRVEDAEVDDHRWESSATTDVGDGHDDDTQDSTRPPPLSRTSSFMSDAEEDARDETDHNLYDWSDEEDLVDQEAKFDESMGLTKRKKSWGPKRIATALFSTLIGSTFLSGCLIAIALLVHFYWYHPGEHTPHRKYVDDNVGAWFYFAAFNVSVSWMLAVIIDLLPAAALGLIHIFWGEVTESMKMHVEVYGVIKGWIKPILYAASIWGSWAVVFGQIFALYKMNDEGNSRASYAPRLYQVVEFFFFFMLVYCIEKICLSLIALRFHRVAFKDRLDAISLTISVLDRLNLYRPKQKIKPFGPVSINSSKLFPDRSCRQSPSAAESTNSTSYPPRKDLNDEEAATGLGTFANDLRKGVKKVLVHDARNVKGKEGNRKDISFSVSTPHAAKQMARAIFQSYRPASANRSYLIPSDFYPAFDTPEQAKQAFRVFDKDNNDDVSRSEIKTVVMRTYKERRFLAKAMQDVGHAVKALNSMLMIVAAVILFFIGLIVFGVTLGTELTSLYGILLGLSFIFSATCSNAFDSVIFLFVTHPFDTGDRVFIGTENLIVKKMGIFSTNFTRADGTEAYYYNSVLFLMPIINVRRSGDMFENMTVQVGWQTTIEQIDQLEKCINTWLETDEQRDIASGTAIMYQHIDYQQSIELTIGLLHLATWQDWGNRWARRTRFHAAVKYYMEQLDIVCVNSSLPLRFIPSQDTELRSPLSPSPIAPPSPSVKRQPSTARPQPKYRPTSSVDPDNELPLEPMRQALGFLPPLNERGLGAHIHGIRRRKTRNRKAMLAMSGA